MKKILLLFTLATMGLQTFAQTDSIEKKILYNELSKNKITVEKFSDIGAKWNQFTKNNTYPDIQFNNQDQVSYRFVETFDDVDRYTLFDRTMEWLAINYGLIPSYVYSNKESGKIIYTHTQDLFQNTKLVYSTIITIKERKIMLEYNNIDYQITTNGYYLNDAWIPESTSNNNIEQIFPIILKKPADWSLYMNIAQSMDSYFRKNVENLKQYITDYNSNYKF